MTYQLKLSSTPLRLQFITRQAWLSQQNAWKDAAAALNRSSNQRQHSVPFVMAMLLALR